MRPKTPGKQPLLQEIYSDRIVAGNLKGRPLILPRDATLRPTKNRVKQAIFNMLGARLDWDGLTVADLCCGSGALGFEALSRGAQTVFLVDTHTEAASRNAVALGVETRISIYRADAQTWAPPALSDVILADPPYGTEIAQTLLNRASTLTRPGSWWMLEIGEKDTLRIPDCFVDHETRTYGLAKVWVGRYAG